MNRAALRLATLAALTNGGGSHPTIAGARVFDSRADPIEDIGEGQALPTIVIYTETDQQDYTLSNKVSLRMLEARIEFGLTTKPPDETQPLWPETDPELESILDLFEHQIEAALFGNAPWATWWGQFFQIKSSRSERFTIKLESGNIRLAAREITFSVALRPNCLPTAYRQGAAAPAISLGLYDQVHDYIVKNGTGTLKAQTEAWRAMLLANLPPEAAAYPPLNTIDFKIAANPPHAGEVHAVWDMNPDT